MSYLILVRHGLSEYNKLGLWTGKEDPELAHEGIEEAKIAADVIKDLPIDYTFTSNQKRHKQTLDIILDTIGKNNLPQVTNSSLNERDYGIYTKKNKWELRKRVGDEEFMRLRRGWDYPIPEGESLKQVYERVVGFFKTQIEPELQNGKNVLISSSGNALRSLVKYLENISDDDIARLEIATGEVYVYKVDNNGKILNKEIRNRHSNTS